MTAGFLDGAATERAVIERTSVASPRQLNNHNNQRNARKRGHGYPPRGNRSYYGCSWPEGGTRRSTFDLFVMSKSVTFHVRNALQKLGACLRADALRVAL